MQKLYIQSNIRHSFSSQKQNVHSNVASNALKIQHIKLSLLVLPATAGPPERHVDHFKPIELINLPGINYKPELDTTFKGLRMPQNAVAASKFCQNVLGSEHVKTKTCTIWGPLCCELAACQWNVPKIRVPNRPLIWWVVCLHAIHLCWCCPMMEAIVWIHVSIFNLFSKLL